MIGPECVAQQKKLVASRIMNCGERIACAIDMSDCGPVSPDGAPPPASAGGRRTSSETGIMMQATMTATICIVVRQSWLETSQATIGDMVIGAIPMPADTSDTARLRWVSNQPVTVAIIGAKIAAIEPPTRAPKMNWNANSEVAWLARKRLAASTVDPVSTTGRGPQRSDSVPQAMLQHAIAKKPIVIALDTPATDQPVSCTIDCNRTGNENIEPMATQPSVPPAATITQRYRDCSISTLRFLALLPSRRTGSAKGDRGSIIFLTHSGTRSRRHLVEFRQVRIETVPGVSAHPIGDGLRLEAGGIVEAGRMHREQVRHRGKRQVDRRAAGQAEAVRLDVAA